MTASVSDAAQHVPSPTGSTTILEDFATDKVTAEDVNAQMKQDIIFSTADSISEPSQTRGLPMGDKTLVQVVSWHDNECSYVGQMIRTIKRFSELKQPCATPVPVAYIYMASAPQGHFWRP